MLHFNWDVIALNCKTDNKILDFFKEITSNKPLACYKRWVQHILAKSLKRPSYIIDPIKPLYFRGCTTSDKVLYFGLAGLRSYNRYVLYNETHLDLRMIKNPETLNAINNNPLLTINDNKIYFKFEEN